MFAKRLLLLVALLVPALPAIGHAGPAAPAATGRPGHAAGTSVVLARSIAGRVVVAGTRVYFVSRDAATGSTALMAYDSVSGATSELGRGRFEVAALAGNDRLLAWIERSQSGSRVQTLEQATRVQRTVLDGAAAGHLVELAVAGEALVYNVDGTHQRGVFAHELDSGTIRRLAGAGSGLVAGAGNVLWTAMHRDSRGAPEWRLMLDRLDGAAPLVLARSAAPFSAYDVGADAAVWSALPPAAERRVWLHRIADGTSEPLSTAAGSFPRLGAGHVVWATEPDGSSTALQSSTLDDGQSVRLRLERRGPIVVWGALADGRVVWSDERAAQGAERQLWLSAMPAAGAATANLAAADGDGDLVAQAARRLCGTPITCGQLAANGQFLVDAGGRWDVRGVQFFLPRFGINAFTFYDRNYWNELAEVDTWLDISRNRLRARLLRIFVELPDGDWQPTSYETVHDFARRAGERGMRLGIVVQNSGDFRMTPERRAWLDGLIGYFAERGATPLIAYISAANEINNWCSRQDCFDQSAAYADAAIAWTSEVAATIKARDPGVLVTVGLSSEVSDSNGLPAVYNFFRRDGSGRTLAGAVDFLSPHNYAGGAYGVYNDIRFSYAYNGPLVLEEFGWTTDPLRVDARFTEGDLSCIGDPWTPACRNTGPFFVEWSLRALREVPYAGGVAWMLADVATKDCASDPSDLWSGLFAAGQGYCGGTRSVAPGQSKATAARVAIFYMADDLSRLVYLPSMRAE